jgi:hypothetical protein
VAEKFIPKKDAKPKDKTNWIMGRLRKSATGNINLSQLAQTVKSI